MLRKRKEPKGKSIAATLMRDLQGTAAKSAMFQEMRAAIRSEPSVHTEEILGGKLQARTRQYSVERIVSHQRKMFNLGTKGIPRLSTFSFQ
jgi:hypothetical protein